MRQQLTLAGSAEPESEAGLRCQTCQKVKPLDDFGIRRASSNGRQPRCRTCLAAYLLRWKWGLTPQELDRLFDAQEGRCLLCGGEMPRPPIRGKSLNRAVIDHDHATGRIRGLLHGGCNMRLEPIEDEEFRAMAMAYLAAVEDSDARATRS